jgi:hypothetical protein
MYSSYVWLGCGTLKTIERTLDMHENVHDQLPEPFALSLAIAPCVSESGRMRNAPTANDDVSGNTTYVDDF